MNWKIKYDKQSVVWAPCTSPSNVTCIKDFKEMEKSATLRRDISFLRLKASVRGEVYVTKPLSIQTYAATRYLKSPVHSAGPQYLFSHILHFSILYKIMPNVVQNQCICKRNLCISKALVLSYLQFDISIKQESGDGAS